MKKTNLRFFRASILQIAVFIVISCFSPAFAGNNSDFAFEKISKHLPPLKKLANIAEKHHATFGVYGGTVRDLYLKRKFSIISDCDMIFNSSEPNFPAFRDEIIKFNNENYGKMPTPDFHFDLANMEEENARKKLYHNEGITATKVGVLSNGTIMDPTGYGCKDLRNRIFRYYPLDRERIEVQNLGRFIRDMVRLHSFKRDPATIKLLRDSLAFYSDKNNKYAQKIFAAAKACKNDLSSGSLVIFPTLLKPSREDVRFLHNDWRHRLTKYYPVDMMVMDLFRTVTQADDMDSMREGLKYLNVDEFLNKLGLNEEAKILLNPEFSRKDIFAKFYFPGFQPEPPKETLSLLKQAENAIRSYSYRVLFEMLASEFPADSTEAKTLLRRKDDFLRPSTQKLLKPDDNFEDMIMGFIDTEINIGLLPREKLKKSFAYFYRTYFNFGNITLLPLENLSEKEIVQLIGQLEGKLTKGYSREILQINRKAPHGFRDLQGYLRFQIGEEFENFYLNPKTAFGFFAADHGQTRALLQKMGYTRLFQVNGPGFSRRKRTIIGFNDHDGRLIVAHYGFYSDEQLLNHQARGYILRRNVGENHPESVFVLRNPNKKDFPSKPEFLNFVKELPSSVDAFFVGFINPLKKKITDIKFHRIGDLSLFSGYLQKPDKEPKLVIAMSAFGANFGSLPANLAEILVREKGLKNIVLLGTGGGIDHKLKRFSWVAPILSYYAAPDGKDDSTFLPIDNLAEDLPIAQDCRRVRHASVLTPLCETKPHVKRMLKNGADSVDCEIYYIAKLIANSSNPVNFYTLINITDFPLNGEEVEGELEEEILGENSAKQYDEIIAAINQIAEDLTNR